LILSVLLKTTCGLSTVEALTWTDTQSMKRIFSRDFMPFQLCDILDVTFLCFNTVGEGVSNMNTQGTVGYVS
jgi:hypothetical protein